MTLEEWKRRFREQLEKAEIKAEQRTPLEKIIDCLETFVEWDDFLEEHKSLLASSFLSGILKPTSKPLTREGLNYGGGR